MTQLTQGSDMELKEQILKLILGSHYGKAPLHTYEPELTQIMQLIQADKQRSIDRAVAEARIDELKHLGYDKRLDNPIISCHNPADFGAITLPDRIAELEQQLSPTTKKDKEVK